MSQISLAYGSTSFEFPFNKDQFTVLSDDRQNERSLNDIQVGEAFDEPIDSPPLDEIVTAGDSVLIVVSDATRATASAQVINLLVRRLVQYGIQPHDIAIIFATGIHRPVTPAEKAELLTPFITQRLRVLDHDANDSAALISCGVTSRGVPIELHKALKSFSHVILTGGVGFHYFAGFTGGRKSVCPGLASRKTIEATHMLALDFEHGGRRSGVGTGLLDGNAVHEECESIAEIIAPSFGINAVVNEDRLAVKLFCGHWRTAHRVACDDYLLNHSVNIGTQRDVVIVSCGGLPHDINMIQAHKALDMAASACREGGTILLLAECKDGLGRPDFLKWFDGDSHALELRLRQQYEVNGQTAWALLSKAERYNVYLLSSLDDNVVIQMKMTPVRSLYDVFEQVSKPGTGYILPRGAAILPRVTNTNFEV